MLYFYIHTSFYKKKNIQLISNQFQTLDQYKKEATEQILWFEVLLGTVLELLFFDNGNIKEK